MTVDDGFAAEPAVMVWADGERDRWLARAAALDHGRQEPGWAELTAEDVASLSPAQVSWLVTRGPADAARAAVTYTSFRGQRQRVDLDKVAIARFGPDVLDFAVDEADRAPDHFGMLLMPYRAARVAPLVAGWLRHLGSARLWARLWLRRHPDLAIRVLLPATTGKPGKVRQQAEDALRHLGTIHDGTLPAVPPLFALSPQAARTVRKGKAPAWTRPEALPQIRPADGGTLPEDDTAALIAALTWSRLEDPPEPAPGDPEPAGAEQPLVVEASAAAQPMVRGPEPEAEKVIARCDPASLAAFGRALLDAWLAADMPAAEAWVLLAQAHIGDDVTMDRLAPLVRGWPPKSRYLRAIDGHAVLATVGSDVSLRHLLAIEENMSDMSGHRFRPARDLPDVLLPHRILGPLARRLLWGEYDPAGRLVRGLRIAEDGSFADLHDSAAAVGGDVPIGVVIPPSWAPTCAPGGRSSRTTRSCSRSSSCTGRSSH